MMILNKCLTCIQVDSFRHCIWVCSCTNWFQNAPTHPLFMTTWITYQVGCGDDIYKSAPLWKRAVSSLIHFSEYADFCCETSMKSKKCSAYDGSIFFIFVEDKSWSVQLWTAVGLQLCSVWSERPLNETKPGFISWVHNLRHLSPPSQSSIDVLNLLQNIGARHFSWEPKSVYIHILSGDKKSVSLM